MRTVSIAFLVLMVGCWSGALVGADDPSLGETEVGDSSEDLRERASVLSSATPEIVVDAIMPQLDDATPLGANWLRVVIDTVFERTLKQGDKLPIDKLREFTLDRSHSPRARRLAYEWLVQVEPELEDSLVATMLDDPSLEMRRDAVAKLITQAEQAGDDRAMYQKAIDAARDLDQINLLLDRLKKQGVEIDQQRLFGFLTEWRVTGPMDNTDEKGYATVYGPETTPDAAEYTDGKHGTVKWKAVKLDHPRGMLDFNVQLEEEKAVCGYAEATFTVDQEQPAQIRVTTFSAVKIWLNGQLVEEHDVYHGGSDFDQYIIPIKLRQGENRVMIKACQNNQPQSWATKWEFQIRITDAIGGPVL